MAGIRWLAVTGTCKLSAARQACMPVNSCMLECLWLWQVTASSSLHAKYEFQGMGMAYQTPARLGACGRRCATTGRSVIGDREISLAPEVGMARSIPGRL